MRPKTFRSLSRNSVNIPAILAMSFAAATFASADATWSGATSQDWNDGTNWSTNPPSGNFFINTATGSYPILSANSAFTPVDVIIGNGGTNAGRLDHTAGSLSLANTGASGNWFFVARGANTATATYNLADTSTAGGGVSSFVQGSGSLTVGKFFVGGGYYNNGGIGTVNINTSGSLTANSTQNFSGQGNASIALGVGSGASGTINLENGTVNSAGEFWVGNIGNGAVNQTGGTVNVNSLLLLARNNGASQSGSGTWNVSGTGQVNVENDLVIAFAGNSSAVGAMNINAGGVVNVGTATERWLIVNRWDSTQGRLTVDGGTLNLNANTDLRFSTGNGTGASFVTLKNGGAINGGATSVVDLMQANVAGNNTFNLDGGTLTISQVITAQNSGTAAFNFNGGTLKASNDSANFVDLGGAGQAANVLAGGAIIDSNGHNVTIVEGLKSTGGDGGLTKNGDGTLTLAGTNTYTGATTVSAGTLFVSGSLGASAVTVESGATIAGNGALGGSLNFDAGSMLDVTGGILTVAGNVSFDGFGFGNLAGFDVNTAENGTYTMMNGSDFDFTNVSNFGLENALDLGGGRSAYFQSGSLQVVVIPEPAAALMGSLGMLALLRRRRK